MASKSSPNCHSQCAANSGFEGAITCDAFSTPTKPNRFRAARHLSNSSKAFEIQPAVFSKITMPQVDCCAGLSKAEIQFDQFTSSTCDSKDSREVSGSEKSSRSESTKRSDLLVKPHAQRFGLMSDEFCFMNFHIPNLFSESKSSSKACRKSTLRP